MGWRTARCVCQEQSDPLKWQSRSWLCGPDASVPNPAVPLPLSPLTGAVRGTQLHFPEAHGAEATLSWNLPRPTRSKLSPFVLLFFSYKDCWKHLNFEMSQLYKKTTVGLLILFLSFTDLTTLNITFKILSGLWGMKFTVFWAPHEAKRAPAYFRPFKKKRNSNITRDCTN